LSEAMREVFKSNTEINCIGTRHGEKLYETLLTREELVKAADLGRYYMVPMDDRDLNYGKFFVEGEKVITEAEDYNSHNTEQLNKQQVIDMLFNLDYIQNELKTQS